MNFLPPLTWFDLGALLGISFAALALVVGVVGYVSDRLYVRRRRLVREEAREMIGVIEGINRDKERKLASK